MVLGGFPSRYGQRVSMPKSILATSVTIITLFYVAVAELLVGRSFFEDYRRIVALALGLLGLCAWLVGWYLTQKRAESEAAGDEKRILLFDFRYWGSMLVLLGGLTLCVQTLADGVALVRRLCGMTDGKKPVVALAVPRPAPAPVTFPTFKIQGIVIRDARSAIIVRGRSYFVGDRIGDATVKEITREAVTLEKSNAVKLISLDEAAPPGISITSGGK